MSHASVKGNITEPQFGQAWADDDGIHATVRLGEVTLYFDDSAHARAVAAACVEAADAMEALPAPEGGAS